MHRVPGRRRVAVCCASAALGGPTFFGFRPFLLSGCLNCGEVPPGLARARRRAGRHVVPSNRPGHRHLSVTFAAALGGQEQHRAKPGYSLTAPRAE